MPKPRMINRETIKDKQLKVLITEKMFHQLSDLSKFHRITKGAMVRKLIQNAFDEISGDAK